MESTVPLNGVDEIRQITENTVIEVVKMVIFLICRNPDFDYLNILPWIKKVILDSLPEDGNTEDKKYREEFIQNQMDAVWLRELYKGLFDEPSGYLHTLKQLHRVPFK